MSYRLINANALNGVISYGDYEKVLNMPCIYADLPNGLDGNHYNLQEPKTGHWKPYLKEGLRYQCSTCDSRVTTPWEYCPHCGAKMIEPQESEDK